VIRCAAALLSASVSLLTIACDGARPSTDPVVGRYRDWRSTDAIAEVTARQLAGWRLLPRKAGFRNAPLEDQLASLLETQRLAEETPLPLSGDLAQRVREAEERVLEQALRAAVQAEAPVPSATEIAALHETQAAGFRRPRLLRLKSLLVRVVPGASEADRSEAYARAEALHAEIVAGAAFDEVARRASDSETRSRGGRLGWVDPARLAPGLRTAALALGVGERTGVLASPNGWVILECEGIREADTEDGGRARAAAAARTRSEREAWSEVRESILADADADPLLRELSPRARIRVSAATRARDQGLDDVPTTAQRLHWTRAQIMAADSLRQRAEQRVTEVDRAAVLAHYEENRERWQTLPSTHLHAIRIPHDRPAAESGSPASRELAAQLRAGLAAGERLFPFAARDLSDHPSRSRGGDLGWLGATEVAVLGPDISRIVQILEIGETSPVVPQPDGLWILRVEARQPGREIPLEEVAETLKHRLRAARVREATANIAQELRAELELELVAGAPDPSSEPVENRSSDVR